MLKWIEACKSEEVEWELKSVAHALYDNTSLRVILVELAEVCDHFELVTHVEVSERFFSPLGWDEYEGRDYLETLKSLYVKKIRWMPKTKYEHLYKEK